MGARALFVALQRETLPVSTDGAERACARARVGALGVAERSELCACVSEVSHSVG